MEIKSPAAKSPMAIGLALLPGFNFLPRHQRSNPINPTGYDIIKFAKYAQNQLVQRNQVPQMIANK